MHELAITQAILERGDFDYLGLIGSATKRARFEHRFEARGDMMLPVFQAAGSAA